MYVQYSTYLHQEAKGGLVEQQEVVSLPHQAIRESSDVDNIHHLVCFSATPWIIFRSCGRLTTGAKIREKDWEAFSTITKYQQTLFFSRMKRVWINRIKQPASRRPYNASRGSFQLITPFLGTPERRHPRRRFWGRLVSLQFSCV